MSTPITMAEAEELPVGSCLLAHLDWKRHRGFGLVSHLSLFGCPAEVRLYVVRKRSFLEAQIHVATGRDTEYGVPLRYALLFGYPISRLELLWVPEETTQPAQLSETGNSVS